VIDGLSRACAEAEARHGISAALILCFLRHLSEEAALATLEDALPYRSQFIGVGLDSSERGNPPEKFARVFARCASSACIGSRTPARRGRPNTSTVRSTCCTSSASTTACAASRTRRWSSASRVNACR